MTFITGTPQALSDDDLAALESCVDYYNQMIHYPYPKSRLYSPHEVRKVGDGYVVRSTILVREITPSRWLHYFYHSYLKRMGVKWARDAWLDTHGRMVLPLAADLRRKHGH